VEMRWDIDSYAQVQQTRTVWVQTSIAQSCPPSQCSCSGPHTPLEFIPPFAIHSNKAMRMSRSSNSWACLLRGNYHIRVFISFVQHENPEIVCSLRFFSSQFNGIRSDDPELVYSRSFEINQQQTYRDQVFMLDG
jgi:hypothetical protein